MTQTNFPISIKQSYVAILLLFGCLVYFGENLNAQVELTCQDLVFVDSGGLEGNYSANEESEYLICPDNSGELVVLYFSLVEIEAAPMNLGPTDNGCFDFLTIYNGDSASSELIGEYCGESDDPSGGPALNLAAGDILIGNNPSGCLYIVFESDGPIELEGWVADITCIDNDNCYLASAGVQPIVCQDINGTPSNPSDDGFVVSLSPTGVALGATYSVLDASDTPILTGLNTNEVSEIGTYPAGGGDIELKIISDENPDCSLDFVVQDPGPCSNAVALFCGNSFVDSGGTSGPYSNSEYLEYLFCPDNADELVLLTFNFMDFAALAGWPCFDELTIYNGSNDNAEILATFCGGDPEVMIGENTSFLSTNATGCLFATFSSSGGGTAEGWEADISCISSESCTVYAVETEVSECHDLQNTPSDQSDDTFMVSIQPIALGVSESFYSVLDESGDVLFEGLPYGTISEIGSFSAGFNDFTITIVDESDAGCFYEVEISNPGYCSPILSCGGSFVDSGGPNEPYLSGEISEYLICPEFSNEPVFLNFHFFDVEASTNMAGPTQNGCWDFLTIYDGDSAEAPVIAEYCGEISGSGNSTGGPALNIEIGETVGSTHSTGCLFAVFTSDDTFALGGWEATVSCGAPSGISQDSVEDFSVSIGPNPVEDILYLNIPQHEWGVRLFNIQGQLLHDGKGDLESYSLSLLDYPKGIYFLEINGINGIRIVRKAIVKQ